MKSLTLVTRIVASRPDAIRGAEGVLRRGPEPELLSGGGCQPDLAVRREPDRQPAREAPRRAARGPVAPAPPADPFGEGVLRRLQEARGAVPGGRSGHPERDRERQRPPPGRLDPRGRHL